MLPLALTVSKRKCREPSCRNPLRSSTLRNLYNSSDSVKPSQLYAEDDVIFRFAAPDKATTATGSFEYLLRWKNPAARACDERVYCCDNVLNNMNAAQVTRTKMVVKAPMRTSPSTLACTVDQFRTLVFNVLVGGRVFGSKCCSTWACTAAMGPHGPP